MSLNSWFSLSSCITDDSMIDEILGLFHIISVIFVSKSKLTVCMSKKVI